MKLGIFRRKNFFIGENVLFYDRYYPKQTRHFSYIMIIATTFTVCLAYRHYRNTRLVQFLVIAYMYVLRFLLLLLFCVVCFVYLVGFVFFFRVVVFSFAKRPDRHDFDDAIYMFIYFFAFYFNVIASKSHTKNYSENGREK